MLFLNQKELNRASGINWEKELPSKLFNHLSTLGIDCLPDRSNIVSLPEKLKTQIADCNNMVSELTKLKNAEFFLSPSHQSFTFLCNLLELEIQTVQKACSQMEETLNKVLSMNELLDQFKQTMEIVTDLIMKGEFDKAEAVREEFLSKLQQQG